MSEFIFHLQRTSWSDVAALAGTALVALVIITMAGCGATPLPV